MADDLTPPRRLSLPTADGVELEAEEVLPPGAVAAVVLAHPHPVHGGSMRSLVTSELFSLLPAGAGGRPPLAVLRFNFRGVEGSGGQHDGGRGEQLDVVAAVEHLAGAAPDLPLLLSGWSFGADVSLAVTDERVRGWCAVAPPLRILPDEALAAARDPRPTWLLVPERDQFNPPASARARTEGWVATSVEVVEGADHFCVGRTDVVAGRVADHAVGLATT